MTILGIETSCDETSAAVLQDRHLLSSIISSQLVHRRYGGVVPELASRAHQALIIPVVEEALRSAGVGKDAIDAVAVTSGPGLMGALLVGVNFAKSLSLGLGKPLIGVNHLEGHLYSAFLSDPAPEFPYLCLIVSGGHTELVLVERPLRHRVLGETIDDAAGEAYDKVAKMIGLGFPGGPAIDARAPKGNPQAMAFPRSMPDGFDFSFSGIKTSVLYWLRDNGYQNRSLPAEVLTDICASFQAAMVDILVGKAIAAAERYHIRDIAVTGGVSANTGLRERMNERSAERGGRAFFPQLEFCTDNAAMIALAGQFHLETGEHSSLSLSAVADLSL